MPVNTKLTVRNWFESDAIFTIELIESFIDGVEKQAQESIAKYENEKKEHVILGVPEENYVTVYRKLDDQTFDLQEIYYEYFPSLQRRSALLTVYGMFENELDKLCSLYSKFSSEKLCKIVLSDLKDKGIDRSTKYLEKVAGLNVYKKSLEWDHIKIIQQIRNWIAHQNGKIPQNEEKFFNDCMKKMDSLSKDKDDEIILNPGFLSHTVKIFKTYLKMIGQSIATDIA